jgi:hypothetical protein
MDSGLDPEILAESAPRGGPQSPAWKRFAFPRWTGPAAAAAGTLVAVVLALQLWPASGSEAQAPEVAASSAAPLPAARAVPAAPEAAPDVAPVPPEPAAPSTVAPSRWVKSFDRAQKALRAGHAYSARTILRAVLGKHPLSRSDRARASKLMGDAEAKLGHRASAASWWRKSLQLYEDPEDRARVSQLLQPHR